MTTRDSHQPRAEYTQLALDAKLQLVQGILESRGLWAATITSFHQNAGRFPSHADVPEVSAFGEVSAPLKTHESQFGFPYVQVVKWTTTVSDRLGDDSAFIDYDFRGTCDAQQTRPAYHPTALNEELLLARNIDRLWIGQRLVQPEVAFEQLDHLIRHAIIPAAN